MISFDMTIYDHASEPGKRIITDQLRHLVTAYFITLDNFTLAKQLRH